MKIWKAIKEWFVNFWKAIKEWFVHDFPWGDDCWDCKKGRGECNPAYCRSIGLRVDK